MSNTEHEFKDTNRHLVDAALRVILRKEVLPEHVEIELARVKNRLH